MNKTKTTVVLQNHQKQEIINVGDTALHFVPTEGWIEITIVEIRPDIGRIVVKETSKEHNIWEIHLIHASDPYKYRFNTTIYALGRLHIDY